MIKLLDLLFMLEENFEIEIKEQPIGDHTLLYTGAVEDIPLSFLKDYCFDETYYVRKIYTHKTKDMVIYITCDAEED